LREILRNQIFASLVGEDGIIGPSDRTQRPLQLYSSLAFFIPPASVPRLSAGIWFGKHLRHCRDAFPLSRRRSSSPVPSSGLSDWLMAASTTAGGSRLEGRLGSKDFSAHRRVRPLFNRRSRARLKCSKKFLPLAPWALGASRKKLGAKPFQEILQQGPPQWYFGAAYGPRLLFPT